MPLGRYPEEFQNLYTEAVFDLDMKDDLERAKVINWCGTIYPLHPLKTTGKKSEHERFFPDQINPHQI